MRKAFEKKVVTNLKAPRGCRAFIALTNGAEGFKFSSPFGSWFPDYVVGCEGVRLLFVVGLCGPHYYCAAASDP